MTEGKEETKCTVLRGQVNFLRWKREFLTLAEIEDVKTLFYTEKLDGDDAGIEAPVKEPNIPA